MSGLVYVTNGRLGYINDSMIMTVDAALTAGAVACPAYPGSHTNCPITDGKCHQKIGCRDNEFYIADSRLPVCPTAKEYYSNNSPMIRKSHTEKIYRCRAWPEYRCAISSRCPYTIAYDLFSERMLPRLDVPACPVQHLDEDQLIKFERASVVKSIHNIVRVSNDTYCKVDNSRKLKVSRMKLGTALKSKDVYLCPQDPCALWNKGYCPYKVCVALYRKGNIDDAIEIKDLQDIGIDVQKLTGLPYCRVHTRRINRTRIIHAVYKRLVHQGVPSKQAMLSAVDGMPV